MSRFAIVLGIFAVVVAFGWGGGPDNPIPALILIIGLALLLSGGVGELVARRRRKVED